MTTANPGGPVPSLHRAALLAGILAVIAGFLSMHILTGSHGTHSHAPVSGSAGHAAADHPAAPASAPTHGQHPSYYAAATTLLAMQSWAASRDRQPDYAYLPGTPSPRDLSISRT